MGAERTVKRFRKRFVRGRVPNERTDTLALSTVPISEAQEEREQKIRALRAEKDNENLSPKRRNRAAAKLQTLLSRRD